MIVSTDNFSPEVFTTELRAKANAIVQVIHYSVSLIITQCSPIALQAVGWKYYVSGRISYSLRMTTNLAQDHVCPNQRSLCLYLLLLLP